MRKGLAGLPFRRVVRRLPLLAVALGLSGQPALAQGVPEADYQADRHGRDSYAGYGDAARRLIERSWTASVVAPLAWQTNLDSAQSHGISGLALDPEISLERTWTYGALSLSATGGLFLSAPLPLPGDYLSGWYGTLELAGGAAGGPGWYLAYDPVGVHADVFGSNLLTRHTLSAGLRHSIGNTSIDLSLRHAPANVDGAGRNGALLTVVQGWEAGASRIQLRGDLEQRWYERAADGSAGREVTRARVRARASIPLDPAITLQLNAQWERHFSGDRAWRFTNFTVGPTLVALLSF